MGKTLETKNKILKLLKEKKMTVTEISEALGLAKSTVSQHISELIDMGMVELEYNGHFKRIKYYKAAERRADGDKKDGKTNGYAIGISAITIISIMLFVIVYFSFRAVPINQTTTISGYNTGTDVFSCPVLLMFRNPNNTDVYNIIEGIANGDPCYTTYIAANGSKFTANMGGLSYTAHNGTLYVPSMNLIYRISGKQIDSLEAGMNSGYCYDKKALGFFNVSFTAPKVKCKAAIFS